jgi:hypothetical protein
LFASKFVVSLERFPKVERGEDDLQGVYTVLGSSALIRVDSQK